MVSAWYLEFFSRLSVYGFGLKLSATARPAEDNANTKSHTALSRATSPPPLYPAVLVLLAAAAAAAAVAKAVLTAFELVGVVCSVHAYNRRRRVTLL